MKSEMLSQEKNVVTLKVTIPCQEFETQLNKTYASVTARANIPGFRKGKAPKKVIEMRFGKEALMVEALEALLPETTRELVSQYDMDTIGEPQFSLDNLKSGEDVELTVKFELYPEVALPDVATLSVERTIFQVSDQMLDDTITDMRRHRAEYRVVNRASAQRDQVKAAFSTSVLDDQGNVVASHDPQVETFILEPLTMRNEILEALLGVSAGDKREVRFQVDPQHRNGTIAGRTACYNFDIIDVLEPVLPELNQDFFKAVEPSKELHTIEEFRADLRERTEKQLRDSSQTVAENEALDKVVEASEVELPDSMIQAQKEHLRRRSEQNLQERFRQTIAEHFADRPQDLENFEKELDQEARRNVKRFLVMDAYAKKEGISVGAGDLDQEIAQMAASYQVAPESVKSMLQKRPEDLQNVIASARYRRTLEAIMDKITVVDVVKALPEQNAQEELEDSQEAQN